MKQYIKKSIGCLARVERKATAFTIYTWKQLYNIYGKNNISELWNCIRMSKIIQMYPDVSKCIQKHLDVSKRLQTCTVVWMYPIVSEFI